MGFFPFVLVGCEEMWREKRGHAVHFGFALQNLSRGLRPIKNRPNTPKTASRFLGARTIFGMAHA